MAAITVARSRTAAALSILHGWRWRLAAAAVLLAYPVWVLGCVYWCTLMSDLPGRRHGPQDAYRHTLASAVVAYTLSPRVVGWVTEIMEGSDRSSLMDRRNNAIGASIGASVQRFAELRPRVEARVQAGAINARDPQQVTWMPPRSWSRLPF